jgi:hypothetical protein
MGHVQLQQQNKNVLIYRMCFKVESKFYNPSLNSSEVKLGYILSLVLQSILSRSEMKYMTFIIF